MNAGLSPMMTYAKWSLMEEIAHAFKDDLYRFGPRSPSAGPKLVGRGAAVQGSWLEMHLNCALANSIASSIANDLAVCGMPGFVAGALGPDGARCAAPELAQASRDAGEMDGAGP